MTMKQQAMINCLGKYARQYFLFKEEPGMDQFKVRLRSDIHRVEQADEDEIEQRLLQRIRDNKIGLLNPQNKPYVPVSGWPVMELDDLVLNAMADQLDPKVWQAVRSQFEKPEIKRVYESRGGEELLKDMSAVHQYPHAGFGLIKIHLAESDARMQNVKAGFDFQQHFIRTRDERLKKAAGPDNTLKQYNADPDFVHAMERVRRDTILFLETLKELLEKMLLLKLRHLRSAVPINLAILGTEKDREGSRQPRKLSMFPGGPPMQHSFRDQIVADAPIAWPAKVPKTAGRLGGRPISTAPRYTRSFKSSGVSRDLSRGSDSGSGSVTQCNVTRRMFHDQEMVDHFRKRWPPVWMSLASLEQGCYIVDPQCPTKEYNACLGPPPVRLRKSLSNILDTRKEWSVVRKNISNSVDEGLWRVDMEKIQMFKAQYATLSHLSLSKPYPNHQRRMEILMARVRSERQKEVIYDCELTEWYKFLVKAIQADVGDQDEEINKLLESIKHYFKMSATSPKFGKAKLSLITMSLPAYVVCHIHVQRAIRFILMHVLEAPEPLMTGWLAARGLPNVLLKTKAV